jgi:plastocyanin
LRKFRPFIVMPFVAAAVLLPASAHPAATATQLSGSVGPAFSIALRDSNGVKVTHLDPGAYTITVDDMSDLHNFHLHGPGGVNQATSVDGTGKVTWDVTFVDGVYTYNCDAHPNLKGTFRVGNAPPPPVRLNGRVGPKRTISLKKASGAIAKVLPAGTYRVVVKDLTKADNFHLKGGTVNKKTGVKFKGTKAWTLKLVEGSYTYRSDAHPKLKRTFKVVKPPTQ